MPRTKKFNPKIALERALDTFWEHGYDRTSTNQLIESMNISKQSLYDTFGTKYDLFIKVLELYDSKMDNLMSELKRSDASIDEIKGYFYTFLGQIAMHSKKQSCLMGKTALERGDVEKQIIDHVRKFMHRTKENFLAALKNAKDKGEISQESDIDGLAKFLTTSIQGLSVMAKCGASEGDLIQVMAFCFRVLS